ncbi:unnamed protein product [Lampetra planeri]
MDREGFGPAEQRQERDLTTPPAAGRDRRACGQRLADLLTSRLNESEDRSRGAKTLLLRPARGKRGKCGKRSPRKRSPFQAIASVPPKMQMEGRALKRRLPFVKEFVVASGDWAAAASLPLANCTLISLAQAAYPKMDKDGLDALVLDRMLGLAQELDVVLPACLRRRRL